MVVYKFPPVCPKARIIDPYSSIIEVSLWDCYVDFPPKLETTPICPIECGQFPSYQLGRSPLV